MIDSLQAEVLYLIFRANHTLHWSTVDRRLWTNTATKNFCHTGEGRCPRQRWVPASPTEQVRGLKARGKTQKGNAAFESSECV
jgi:hypothetical protein